MFGKLISRARYLLLLRLIHFCDNSQQIHDERLYKIQMVISDVQKNFKDSLIPFSNLAIDESLLLWKGRLSFKQYIKSKRHRFGIKLYILCDCETNFILNFSVYIGASAYKKPLEQGCPTFCEYWATSYQYKLWWATNLFLIIIHSNLMVKLYSIIQQYIFSSFTIAEIFLQVLIFNYNYIEKYIYQY
jgi:hypothetical protein